MPLPPVPRAARHLLDQFLELGPASRDASGLAPITFAEIGAWQAVAGIELLPWEARLMRRLSSAYVSQHALSAAPDALPPWGAVTSDAGRDAISRRVRLIFGARARKP